MVQASLDGILLGILFALIAYGMALQWGVMNIINIAQGELVILGGYIAYFMYVAGIHPAFGVIVAPIIMYFVGWTLYKTIIFRVVDRDLFISILATFGISILTQQLMNFIFGSDVVVAQSNFGTTFLFNYMVTLPNAKIFAAGVSIIFAIFLVIYMRKSKLGRAIRATAQNARAAKILGVDTEKSLCCNLWNKCCIMWCCWFINCHYFYFTSLRWPALHSSIFYDCYYCWFRQFTRCCIIRNGFRNF